MCGEFLYIKNYVEKKNMSFLKHNSFNSRKLTISTDISESGYLYLDGEGVIVDEEGELVEFTEEQEQKLLAIEGFEIFELAENASTAFNTGLDNESTTGKTEEFEETGENNTGLVNEEAGQELEEEKGKIIINDGNIDNNQTQMSQPTTEEQTGKEEPTEGLNSEQSSDASIENVSSQNDQVNVETKEPIAEDKLESSLELEEPVVDEQPEIGSEPVDSVEQKTEEQVQGNEAEAEPKNKRQRRSKDPK